MHLIFRSTALLVVTLLLPMGSAQVLGDPPVPAGRVETLPSDSPYGAATAIRNVPYVPDAAPAQTFDLYLPTEKSSRPLPFVVWLHGGAWELSSKEWNNVKYLVKHGYALATVDYRLAPRYRFPAQIQDGNAALNFLLRHAASYGLDPRRFVVGGASAGGHLCLLLGLARHEQSFGAAPAVHPLGILDFFGPSDLNGMGADLQAAHSEEGLRLMERVVPQLLGATPQADPAAARAASPLTYVTADAPPVLIFQGTADPLVPGAQSERLHTRLDDLKVENRLVMVPDAPHDGPAFSTPDREAEVLAFLRRVMP